jgi:hypothetical protein
VSACECRTPRTLFRRCGAVWCCRHGNLFTLGYASGLDFQMGLRTIKAWVRVDKVKELSA